MEIITVKEVAKLVKSSQAFVYKHYKDLGGFKIAGIIRFNKQYLEKLIGEKGDDCLPAPRKLDV